MSRLSYQIPNFNYPGVAPADLYDVLIAQAKEADASGFDRLTVMDHFYQLPGIGAHDEAMIEAYTLLAALAQHTENMRLGTLVTGNTYRNPAMLAKIITALDVVSHGRATLGIGAGWYELEHQAMGYDFGSFTDRFERLEEALQIVLPLLRGEIASLAGERYQVSDFVNSPQPVSKVPIMIGGSGEKKTLRMVAQYADESNLVGLRSPEDIPRKLEALDGHCERLGRDRSEISVTLLVAANIAPTMEQADEELRALLAHKGQPAEMFEPVKAMLAHGDPETVGEKLATFTATGLDGLAVSLMANGHMPGRVAMLGEVATAALQ
ncbi:MAG: LLM class F420-dependent oxidoreductase [Actinomycetota bacterium]